MEANKNTSCCNKRNIGVIAVLFGIAFIVLGIVLPGVIKTKIDQGICDQVCVPQSNAPKWKLDNWANNLNETEHPPLYRKFYVYNITNLAAVVNGTRPVVEELGPFVYRVYYNRFNISYFDDGNTVAYQQGRMYVFEPTLSQMPDSSVVIAVNFPYLAGEQFSYWQAYPNQVFSFECKDPHKAWFAGGQSCLFFNRTVRELLFSYDSKITALANVLLFQGQNRLDTHFEQFINVSITNTSQWDEQYRSGHYFGFGGKCTPEAFFNGLCQASRGADLRTKQNTGKSSLADLSKTSQWLGNSTLSIWEKEVPIKGNDFFQFTPHLTTKDSIELWSEDVLRTIPMHYVSTEHLQDIEVYRFQPTEELFGGHDPLYFGPNVTGLINATTVALTKYGIPCPVFISRPYLYKSNVNASFMANCANCDASKAEANAYSFVDIEPISGKVLGGALRAQINAHVGQKSLFANSPYNVMPEMFLPVFWFVETSTVTADQAANLLKPNLDKVNTATDVSTGVKYGGPIGGGVILFLGMYLISRHIKEKNEKGTAIAPEYGRM